MLTFNILKIASDDNVVRMGLQVCLEPYINLNTHILKVTDISMVLYLLKKLYSFPALLYCRYSVGNFIPFTFYY